MATFTFGRSDVETIGREIVDAAGAGRPTHPELQHDIMRAMTVALNSQRFRDLLAEGIAYTRPHVDGCDALRSPSDVIERITKPCNCGANTGFVQVERITDYERKRRSEAGEHMARGEQL